MLHLAEFSRHNFCAWNNNKQLLPEKKTTAMCNNSRHTINTEANLFPFYLFRTQRSDFTDTMAFRGDDDDQKACKEWGSAKKTYCLCAYFWAYVHSLYVLLFRRTVVYVCKLDSHTLNKLHQFACHMFERALRQEFIVHRHSWLGVCWSFGSVWIFYVVFHFCSVRRKSEQRQSTHTNSAEKTHTPLNMLCGFNNR